MGLCPCSGVEAVDIGAAGIVDEVGLGAADEMAQLRVSATVSCFASGCSLVGTGVAHAMGILVGKKTLFDMKASVSRLRKSIAMAHTRVLHRLQAEIWLGMPPVRHGGATRTEDRGARRSGVE